MLMLTASLAYPQKGREYIDSLEVVVESISDDSVKIALYNELSMLYRHRNPGKGLEYAASAISISEKLGNPRLLAKSYITLAISERNLNLEQYSLAHFQTVLHIARENDLDIMIGQACNNIARLYLDMNNQDSVRRYLLEAAESVESTPDLNVLSYLYLNMGILESRRNNLDSATKLLRQSYIIRHDSLNISTDYLVPLCHLSDIYMKKGDYAMAKNCLYMSLSNKGFSQWDFFHSRIWLMLSQVYYKAGELDSALISAKTAVRQSISCNNIKCLQASSLLLDSIYINCGDYRNAALTCIDFMGQADSINRRYLEGRLGNIQHTQKYIENERTLGEQKQRRKVLLYILITVAAALAFAIPFIIRIIRSNRYIKNLNKKMSVRRTMLMEDLNNTYMLQMALQPTDKELGAVFLEMFLLYMPRDVVSGDFFWKQTVGEYELIAVADCTGHGIPAAMLVMLGICTLNDILASGEVRPDCILEELRTRIKLLMSTNALNKMKDGMDISLVSIHRKSMTMEYAGAYNSLYYIRNGKMYKMPATRCPIGEYVNEYKFEKQVMQLQIGDCIYMMTDGYWSQFGGVDQTKMKHAQFLDILHSIHQKSMKEQKEILENFYAEWRGLNDQVDDVTVVGFRV